MHTVIFKSRHALEQYPKIKFRVRKCIFQQFFPKILVIEPGGPFSRILKLTGWNVCISVTLNTTSLDMRLHMT